MKMGKNIKIVRTMNNTLIVGDVKETKTKVTVQDPYGMIPMEDGIRLVPLDIEITGSKMESIEFSQDKVMYVHTLAPVIVAEYEKLLDAANKPEVEVTESGTMEFEPETASEN